MIYNRGRNYTRTQGNNEKFNNNPDEYSLEQKIFRNTTSIISKVTQLNYQVTVIEEMLTELMDFIKKVRQEAEKEIK